MKTLTSDIDFRYVRQGVTITQGGCYFAVWAPNATAVIVHLFDKNEKEISKVNLPERNGGTWYGFIPNVSKGDMYALEALGEYDPSKGLFFKKDHLLVDPYAKAISKIYSYDLIKSPDDNSASIPKAIVIDDKDFDWQGVEKPRFGRKGLIIYEANVKGLTQLNDKVDFKYRGKYLGICSKSVIDHLKKLGITAIQLNPIAAFISEPHLAKHGLVNYWGYNPVSFMAPDPKYAVNPKDCVNEFKTMVRELHRNGIAVILDVVYNHTGEGGLGGPVLSMRGLDARNYYVYAQDEKGNKDYSKLHDVSGCGNSVNVDSKATLNLVLKAMTHWVEQMQVDGFRFDLGVAVCRETHGNVFHAYDQNSAFLKSCFCIDSLSECIKIAEPWDIGFGGYQLGQFPVGWSEQNDKFRDCIRRFWRGDSGIIGEFATRLMGSRDVFSNQSRSINASVNFVTYHDGFTLEDLVSYSQKHNEANGEENRDGSDSNNSINFGVEGPTQDPEILDKRWQLKRNLMTTLFIAQGIPHMLAGDEFSKTQGGNNNVYCQDNITSWQKWKYSKENQEFIEFISNLSKLRQSSEMLKELNLIDDNFHIHDHVYEAHWYNQNGEIMRSDEWNNPNTSSIMLTLGKKIQDDGEKWLFVFNQKYEFKEFKLPALVDAFEWIQVFDSTNPTGKSSTGFYGIKNCVTSKPCIKVFRQQFKTSTKIYENTAMDSVLRHPGRLKN